MLLTRGRGGTPILFIAPFARADPAHAHYRPGAGETVVITHNPNHPLTK